jgi:type II secretory pathway component PulC
MSLKKPLLLMNICFAVLILCIAWNTFYKWNYKSHEKDRLQDEILGTKSSKGTSSVKPNKLKDYEVIIRRDIFKTKKVPQKADVEQEKPIKITDLNLKLMGTVVGKDRDCFAIIMDGSTKKPQIYHLNDFIQGTRIVGILSDRVILDMEGEEECLMFTDEPGPSVRRPPIRKNIPPHTRKKRIRPMI